ncbi:hypothetical protein [Streptomyces sp. 8ZJF_21]|uniref:hypothetical protein n=1 Tax=Streptomyces sp. 8ZJF_21 TaxID=2903141 RepID=UPI001E5B8A86|nr:hypothetical protein [Streptomyces sp. 8ZJF_21]MCD9592329.1 hypothetical protein [Streptomyces sp. 8ZJF_21]
MVYIRTSTLNSIEAAVDKNNGAVVIRNARVRDWEGRDRLRVTRLQAVRAHIVRRGLRTFPDRLLYSDERWAFVVYRPELLVVDAGLLASDLKMREALEYVMDALNKSAYEQFQINENRFVRMLLRVTPAQPKIHWEFKRPNSAA